MNAHLLSIATLHAAAPGVLDVVFGPDGDFEGAPLWTPALYMMVGCRFVHDWQRTEDVIWLDLPPHGLVAHGHVALDLRLPSVAARLAGLCARALGHKLGVARACFVGTHYSLIALDDMGCTSTASWCLDGRTLSAARPSLNLDEQAPDGLLFLASLFLSLAPRIAALRKP